MATAAGGVRGPAYVLVKLACRHGRIGSNKLARVRARRRLAGRPRSGASVSGTASATRVARAACARGARVGACDRAGQHGLREEGARPVGAGQELAEHRLHCGDDGLLFEEEDLPLRRVHIDVERRWRQPQRKVHKRVATLG